MARVLRMKDLPNKVGLSEPQIFKMMREGSFPRSFRLTESASGWLESTVDAWIIERSQDLTVPVGQPSSGS